MNNKNESNNIKYRMYKLTYPFSGAKIYKSKSFKKAVKQCCKEFCQLNDINEGIFSITDIKSKKEYNFKINNKKIHKINKYI